MIHALHRMCYVVNVRRIEQKNWRIVVYFLRHHEILNWSGSNYTDRMVYGNGSWFSKLSIYWTILLKSKVKVFLLLTLKFCKECKIQNQNSRNFRIVKNQNHWVKVWPPKVLVGGGSMPRWYEPKPKPKHI